MLIMDPLLYHDVNENPDCLVCKEPIGKEGFVALHQKEYTHLRCL